MNTDPWFYATGPSSPNPLKYALLYCAYTIKILAAPLIKANNRKIIEVSPASSPFSYA